jgi:glutamyl-tRNA synthetase
MELYEEALVYYEQYDKDFYNILLKDKDYSLQVLNIERDVPRPRMDIGCYKDIKKETDYMFDELFNPHFEHKNYDLNVLDEYLKTLDLNDDKDTWWNKVKEVALKLGYAADMKAYKLNPENYKGNVADIAEIIRLALTGRLQSPNLYEIQQVLGIDKITKRFNYFKENCCN